MSHPSLALLEQIQQSRTAFNFRSSIFLSERLVQLEPSEENKCILAECYIQSNSFSQVYDLLKGAVSDRAKYLFAFASFKLDKLVEAATALTKISCNKINNSSNITGMPGNGFYRREKPSKTSQFLINLTKKGLNSFTDFFGKKKKKQQIILEKKEGTHKRGNLLQGTDSKSILLGENNLQEPNFLKIDEILSKGIVHLQY